MEQSNIRIFDTHAHYDDEAFEEDRDAVLERVHYSGVEHIVNVACSMETSREMSSFIKKYDYMYGTVGVHPDEVAELTDADMSELKKLANAKKIVAIGEIGLDYHNDGIDKELQKKWFAAQIDIAKEINYPISIHSRDAAKDTLDVMKAEHAGDVNGVMHCFGYGVEMAKEFLDMGYYIGVGGVVTFNNGRKLKEVVDYTPIDRIVLETDCPYLCPVPFRGKRNDSGRLTLVAEEIARIKDLDVSVVYEVTYKNAMKLYNMLDDRK